MRSGTQLDPREVFGNHSALAVALWLGECRKVLEPAPDSGGEVLWLLAAEAWASVTDGLVL